MGYFIGYIIIIVLGFVFNMPTFLLALLIAALIYFFVYVIWLDDSETNKNSDEYSLKKLIENPNIKLYLTKLLQQKKTLNDKLKALEKLSELDFGDAKKTFGDTLKDAKAIMDANFECAYKRFVFLSTEKEVDNESHAFLEKIVSKNDELLKSMNSLLIALTEVNVKSMDIKWLEDLSAAIRQLSVEEE